MEHSAHTEEHGLRDEVQSARREVAQILGVTARRMGRTVQTKRL